MECHPRTVYRDLEALQVAGFPIYTERSEGKNLWSLLDTVKHQIPVPFSLTELMALYQGILIIFFGFSSTGLSFRALFFTGLIFP